MEFEEHPLLHVADLMLALLRAGDGRTATLVDAARLLSRDRDHAREDRRIDQSELAGHLDRARRHLHAARLVEALDGVHYRTTPRGRAVLHRHPDGIDDSVLVEFPEFRDWMRRVTAHAPPEDTRAGEFQHGWAASQEGRDLSDNPFPPDTAQHAAWEDGWLEAERRRRE